ncbi:MAG TPA: hypothetical protein VF629_24715 [Hymenobacter sp.]|jgi:hypothetical protein|uniref:hypothetical protein n=1 Tax=Hymenobacter sp. TaxID=1898978 RepID=UPI002ED82745
MRVASAWPLPGLGLLVLPDSPTPQLDAYALHTAIAVEAVLPDGSRRAATATVEEITRDGAASTATRGLLLDVEVATLPAGTTVWLRERRDA